MEVVLEEISPGRVRLSVEEAQSLGRDALLRIGYEQSEAQIIADHVIDAALCGYEYSGLAKILNIPSDRRFKLPRSPMRVRNETPVAALLDGGNNVGMLTVYQATRIAIEKAQKAGCGIVGVGNTWMSGRVGYYSEMAARADLISIHAVGSTRGVAPPGGTRAVLGTNPVSFGFPTGHGPFVFDMGTSAIMGTDVLLRMRLGQLLPEGVALDPEGRPTRDPRLAKGGGALLPFAGHKGFGLGLVMQMLGLFAGSGMDIDKDNGILIILLKPDLLSSTEEFKVQADELLSRVKSNPRQPGVDEIRVPSERSFRSRTELMRKGLEIDGMVYDSLLSL